MFGERIKLARKIAELKKRDFKKLYGITASEMTSYENNTGSPDSEILMKIAEATGVTLDFLFREPSNIKLKLVHIKWSRPGSGKKVANYRKNSGKKTVKAVKVAN